MNTQTLLESGTAAVKNVRVLADDAVQNLKSVAADLSEHEQIKRVTQSAEEFASSASTAGMALMTRIGTQRSTGYAVRTTKKAYAQGREAVSAGIAAASKGKAGWDERDEVLEQGKEAAAATRDAVEAVALMALDSALAVMETASTALSKPAPRPAPATVRTEAAQPKNTTRPAPPTAKKPAAQKTQAKKTAAKPEAKTTSAAKPSAKKASPAKAAAKKTSSAKTTKPAAEASAPANATPSSLSESATPAEKSAE